MTAVMEALLRGYKRWLSPLFAAQCRYVPTCSEYAAEAVACHGVVRGSLLAAWRLLRCHPLAGGGHDPVPPGSAMQRAKLQPEFPRATPGAEASCAHD